jgi:hypothetical protein
MAKPYSVTGTVSTPETLFPTRLATVKTSRLPDFRLGRSMPSRPMAAF